MSTTEIVFVLMVFAAVFLLAYTAMVPTFGTGKKVRDQLRRRLRDVRDGSGRRSVTSLLREKYLKQLSPIEQWLESLPGMAALSDLIEQGGRTAPAYRLILFSTVVGTVVGIGGWLFTGQLLVSLIAGVIAGSMPFVNIVMQRGKRLAKFEEQLPSALDVVARALRAGHPFGEALHLVGEEMDDPVAKEFEMTFADMNYGNDARIALLNLLERVPSVNVMALVVAVLIQRETGGNLSEILGNISTVVRSRFRFQRKVRTLSAEGRLSAWILGLIPFVLFAMISIVAPDYIPMLTEDPAGRKLILAAFVMLIIGMFWVRHIIRVQV
jgi:tight adherence protein B